MIGTGTGGDNNDFFFFFSVQAELRRWEVRIRQTKLGLKYHVRVSRADDGGGKSRYEAAANIASCIWRCMLLVREHYPSSKAR